MGFKTLGAENCFVTCEIKCSTRLIVAGVRRAAIPDGSKLRPENLMLSPEWQAGSLRGTRSSNGRQTAIQPNHLAANEVGGIGGKEVD
jgi:hypothetical protein